MKILYIDTGLRFPDGHLASSGLSLPPAFRRLGHQVTVLGHCELALSLQNEIGALPYFRIYTWQKTSADPLVGWMVDFAYYVDLTVADLHRAWREFGPFDLVYVNTARPVQLAATGLWIKEGFPDPGAVPAVVVQLGTTPGLLRSEGSNGPTFTMRDPSTLLHRYATNIVGREWMQKLALVAVNATIAEEYGYIADLPVTPTTAPEELPTPRRRAPPDTLTIGFLGHQRIDKGYEFLPDLIFQLLNKHNKLRFVVQHSDPDGRSQAEPERMANVTARLRSLADRESNVELILKPATGAAWFSLIDRCDIIGLPYEPANYTDSYSAIFGEALASGAVIVAPANTTMATEIMSAGGVGTTFDDWTVPSIADAIDEAVGQFRDLALRAYEGGQIWRKHRGPDAYVCAIIKAAGSGSNSEATPVGAAEADRFLDHRPLPKSFIYPRLHNGASVRQHSTRKAARSSIPHPIRRYLLARILNAEIETSKQPFVNAVIFHVDARAVRKMPRHSRLSVDALIEVRAGAISLMWVDRTYEPASNEMTLAAKLSAQYVTVSVPADQAHALVMRNVGTDGKPATFVLRWLNVATISNSSEQRSP